MQKTTKNQQLEFYSKRLIPTLTAISFILGIFVGAVFLKGFEVISNNSNREKSDNNITRSQNIPSSEYFDAEFVEDFFQIYSQKYLGENGITTEEATHGLIKGFLDELDDRYTYFLDPEEAAQYKDQASGDFEGIGVVLSFQDDYTFIETVIKDHPAESAGLLTGDIIAAVDGEDMAGKLPGEVANVVRGEKGTDVVLSIFRQNDGGTYEEQDITVTRDRIEIDNVSWEKVNSNTVKIDIVQFSDESAQKFNESWDTITSEIVAEVPNVENIIVDLRNNPGGYVFSVRYVLEEFLGAGDVVMKERTKEEAVSTYRDTREGAFESQDIIVLVNEGSASASEIFAGAIQDNNRGEVVGEPTVGKGVEQEVFTFPDDSLLFIVFQEWLTPSGKRISEKEPIQPDHVVEYTVDDFKAGNDTQLDKALELLKK